MPKTKGPAIGFLKKVCNKKPDTDSAPPKIEAVNIRGNLIFQIISLSIVPTSVFSKIISNIRLGDISTVPVFMLSTIAKINIAIKKINAN